MAVDFSFGQKEEILAAAAFLVDVLAEALVEVARERQVGDAPGVGGTRDELIAWMAKMAEDSPAMAVIRKSLADAGAVKVRDLSDKELSALAARLRDAST